MNQLEAGATAVPQRTLGFWTIWALGVGAVVGDGIFLLLGQGIEKAGPSAWLAFLVAGVFQLCLMVALGELALGMPTSGAMSDWVRRMLGDWWGFLAGFAFALGWVFAGGAVGIAIGQISCWFISPPPPGMIAPTPDPILTAVFAIGFLTLFAVLNYLGADIAAKTQLVLVLILVGLMAAFAIAGAGWTDSRNYEPFMPNGWGGFWQAVPLGTYAYLGAITLATAGGECRDPRDLPRALVWSSITFLIIYTAAQVVVLGIVPWQHVAAGTSPFTTAADRVFGRFGGWVINLAGWLAAATTLMMGTIYATSRIFYAQARSGYLPRQLGYIHPKRGTPSVGIFVVWAVSIVLVVIGMRNPNYFYEFYGLQLVFAWMVSWLLALVAAVVYRCRHSAEVRGLAWKQPLYPLFPIGGLIGIVVVTYVTVDSEPTTALIGAGWIGAAGIYYMLVPARRRREVSRT